MPLAVFTSFHSSSTTTAAHLVHTQLLRCGDLRGRWHGGRVQITEESNRWRTFKVLVWLRDERRGRAEEGQSGTTGLLLATGRRALMTSQRARRQPPASDTVKEKNLDEFDLLCCFVVFCFPYWFSFDYSGHFFTLCILPNSPRAFIRSSSNPVSVSMEIHNKSRLL